MQFFILKLSGSITIGDSEAQLQKQIDTALDRGFESIVLDMEHVDYLDSSAVGVLAAAYATITERNGQIALVALKPKIRKLLQIMSFIEIFQVYDSLEDALQIMRKHSIHQFKVVPQPQRIAV